MVDIAYIDPGIGSLVLQILAAGVFGALFALKLFWRRIKTFCRACLGKKVKEGDCVDG